MEQLNNVIQCYNASAEEYSRKFLHELNEKPFDRMMLKRFAEENPKEGIYADLGCGPGQTTGFLYRLGLKKLTGIDLSSQMTEQASKNFPEIKFETGNMLQLNFPNEHFNGIVAFYAIVHFTNEEILKWLVECKRLLKPGGQLLFSFHSEEKTLPVEEFLGQKVSVNWYFFDTAKVTELIMKSGLKIVDCATRTPYTEEHPSMRTYILAVNI